MAGTLTNDHSNLASVEIKLLLGIDQMVLLAVTVHPVQLASLTGQMEELHIVLCIPVDYSSGPWGQATDVVVLVARCCHSGNFKRYQGRLGCIY